MTQHNGHHAPDHDAIERTTPFDEATDLLEEEDATVDDDDRVRIERISLPSPKALIMLVAILLAPVFALPFGLNAALAVLVIAMAVTTWLAWDGARLLVAEQAALLRRAAMINAIVALMALALLLARMMA